MIGKKIALIGMFIACVFPLWILFAYSLSKNVEVLAFPIKLWPGDATLANYHDILESKMMMKWIYNSAFVIGITTVVSTIVSAMTGYVFALYTFHGKKILWALILFGIMIPRISILIPLFVVSKKINISGTIWAAIGPLILSPFGIYLARNYFETIPKSIIEAARIDGAGDLGILYHVGFPLCGPIMAALALFSAIGAMGDYIWQNLQLQRPENQTVLVGLMRIATRFGAQVYNQMGRQMAVACILLVPSILIFAMANKYFVSGLSGAVKE